MNQDAYDILKNMNTVTIDLETTGLKAGVDQIYSGGIYNVKNGALINKSESFFDIKRPEILNPTVDDLTNALKMSHSSSEFGKRQAGEIVNGKGTGVNVLKPWAEAVVQGKTEGVSDFVGRLNSALKDKDGSILLLQNVNFEDRELSRLHHTLRREGGLGNFTEFTSNLLDKGLAASSDPRFGEVFNRYLLPKNIFDLRQNQFTSLRAVQENIRNEGLGTHLQQYYQSSMNIVDKYMDNIVRANQTGKTAVVDIMDLSKAIYAHGAVSGQVKPEMLTFGSKVETLAPALLSGRQELHSALDDSEIQSQLFQILTDELKVIKEKGPSYQSPVVDKLVKQIEKDSLYSVQSKDRALSVTREYLEGTTDLNKEGLISALDKRFFNQNTHLSHFTKDEFNISDYYTKLKAEANKFFDEKGAPNRSAEQIQEGIEEFTSNYKTSSTSKIAKTIESSFVSKMLRSKTAKITAGVAGVGLVGSMLFGGDKEKRDEVKYNTYDELYNNQYYGSAFADWQNRNNSHRML